MKLTSLRSGGARRETLEQFTILAMPEARAVSQLVSLSENLKGYPEQDSLF